MKHVPINRNVAVVGPTGSGKTVGWVIPSIMAAEGSVVVTDTKGTLHSLLRDRLEQQGYVVHVIDFVNPVASSVGYDPLDQIRVTDGKPNEQDMATVAHALCPIENLMDPFWDYAACNLIQSMIGYVMEALPEEEHNLSSVAALYQCIADGTYAKLIDELETMSPDSYAVRQYASTRAAKDANADKMIGSIAGIVGEKLSPFGAREIVSLFTMRERIDFDDLRKRKTALFLNTSDCDRSVDRLVSLCYSQMYAALIRDWMPGVIPVDVIHDDFAAGTRIAGFDGLISVVRSRDIRVNIIVQSLAQLQKLYWSSAATIVENCDTVVYLGGNDISTAGYIGARIGCNAKAVLELPPGEALVLQRGTKPRRVEVVVTPVVEQTPQLADAG